MDDDFDDLMTVVHRLLFDAPIVHQAGGVLMARLGITIEEAVTVLHATAAARGLDVTKVAAGVVSSVHGRSDLN